MNLFYHCDKSFSDNVAEKDFTFERAEVIKC